MSDSIFEYKKLILEHHLDTFGHVNNATYLELFEEARWDIITRGGYGLKEVQQKQQGPVILDVKCRFRREIINRETITIKTRFMSWKGKIGVIHHEMYKEDGELASEADFTIGFMDFASRKLMNAPNDWVKACQQ